jgi:hypothetical protein
MSEQPAAVTRVQTGVRLESRMLNVLKALAALKGMTLGDLLEGIVLHSFEGKSAFSDATLLQIRDLKKVYGLTLKASDSHLLTEVPPRRGAKTAAPRRKRNKS